MLSLSIQRALYGGRKRDVLASLFNSSGEDIGPEVVTDGHFTTTATGWGSSNATSVIVAGELEVTATVSGGRCEQNLTLVAGKTYTVTAKVRRGTATSVRVHIIRGAAGGYGTITGSGWVTDTTTKTISFTFTAPGTDAIVQLACNSAGTGYFDDVSIRSGTAQPKGFYYDPSDFIKYKASGNIKDCTLFQDAAGTAPVTAVEQPVGLILDKSKGLVRGVELVPDPDIDNPAAWFLSQPTSGSVTVSGGVGRINSVDGTQASFGPTPSPAIKAGVRYEYEVVVSAVVSGNVVVDVGNATGAAMSTVGTHRGVILTTNTNGPIIKRGGVCDVTVSRFSLKELPGHHASQSTAASRPVLTARKNWLRGTNAIGTSPWIANSAPTATQGLPAPDGTSTATRIVTSASSNSGYYQTTDVSLPVATYTVSLSLKDNGGTGKVVRLGVGQQAFGGTGGDRIVDFDMVTGAFSNVNAVFGTPTSIQGADGTWSIRLTYTATSAGQIAFAIYSATASTMDFIVSLPQWEYGSTATRYQRVTTATDYDWQGFPLWIKHDGVDDWLQTGNIDFTAYDKVTVVAGVTKLSDAAIGVVCELSTDPNNNAGTFGLVAPRIMTSGDKDYGFRSRGAAALQEVVVPTVPAPHTTVLCGIANIGGDSISIRSNGALTNTSTTDQGTGNYGNYPLYIGRRGGTTLPFNGQWSVLVGVATASPLATTTIQSAERKAASKTGVTIT